MKPGDCVVVKPNLVNGARPDTAITTHPSVVVPLVHLAKEAGAGRVVVAENMMWAASARRVFERSGMGEAVRGAGAEVVYLDEDEQVEVNVKGGKLLRKIKLAKTVLDADVFISVPKMKTSTGIFGISIMKNIFGLFSLSVRQRLHKSDPVMAMGIMDLMRVVKPKLTIVDGIVAGEGDGPILVDPVKMNTLIAGFDPVAVESVTATCMGFDPREVETARLGQCEKMGTMDLARISVKGESIVSICRPFKRPNASLVDRWPGVEVYLGGGCCPGGCHGMLTALFSMWEYNGKLEKALKKTGRIIVILGRGVPRSPRWNQKVVVVGDCAASHRRFGVFVPGCPPFPPAITKALDLAIASKSGKDATKSDVSTNHGAV